MDNYREVDLLPTKAVGASGTETIDIAIDEPLTSLSVYFSSVNEAAVEDEVPPEGCLDKIEIIDGGQVYWSTTGPEVLAAFVYETNRWPNAWYDERTSNEQNVMLPLLFGRYLGDEEFAFSPTKLLNPQLKITWTRNAKHTTTGYQLGVRVKAMQGVAPPSKALMVKNIKSWTSPGTGIESTSLPVNLDYRKLYIHTYIIKRYYAELVTHFKLDCDVGKLIVFDVSQYGFLDLVKDAFPSVMHSATICMDDGVWKESFTGNLEGCAVNSGSPGYFANAWHASASRYQQWSETHAGAAAADVPSVIDLRGYLPWTTYCYPFGRQQEPASWFKASRFGQIQLQVTQGEAAVPIGILLQRPTPLP